MRKIKKYQARMCWETNTPFWIAPCNMRLDSAFCTCVNPENAKTNFDSFDAFLNSYIFYNCNRQTGFYPHYYTAD